MNILLIEDNPGDVRLLKEMLRESELVNVKLEVAGDLNSGIRVVEENVFDLLLLDLGLPDSHGLNTLRQARRSLQQLPIIVLTGLNDSETGIAAIQEGAQDYLIKGQVDGTLLHRTISYAIERYKSEKTINQLRRELARILESAGEGIIYIDHEGKHRQVNPAAAKMLGYGVDELLGKPSHVLWHYAHEDGREHPQEQCPIYKTIRDGKVRRRDDDVFWRKGGQCFPVEYVAAPFGSERTSNSGVVVVFQDITQRKRDREALRRHAHQQEIVAELGKEALAGKELSVFLENSTKLLRQTLKADYCLIFTFSHSDNKFFIGAGNAWDQGMSKGSEACEGCSALGRLTVDSGKPLIFNDLSNEQRFSQAGMQAQGIRSGMSLSIHGKRGYYGVLTVLSRQVDSFSQDDLNFVQTVVNLLSTTIQRKEADEEIERLATTDELTGAANRRRFDEFLFDELSRAKRYGTTFSIIMYDLDHFKDINDTYGHNVGDEVLRTIVEIVQHNIRQNDLQARWGGEEFMIVSPETTLSEAEQLAEKLRSEIEQHQFGEVPRVTVSMGVTQLEKSDDWTSLGKKADEALYQAKRNGRNRVETVCHGDEV